MFLLLRFSFCVVTCSFKANLFANPHPLLAAEALLAAGILAWTSLSGSACSSVHVVPSSAQSVLLPFTLGGLWFAEVALGFELSQKGVLLDVVLHTCNPLLEG